jgi:hypothetical protein
MLFHVVEKCYSVYGAGISGVYFSGNKKTPLLDPHASVPVPAPIEWLINVVGRNIII